MFNLNSNFQCWDLKQSTGGSQYVSRNLNALLTFKIHPCEWICWPHWVVGTQDKKAYRWSFVCVVDQDQANRARNADHAARTFQSFVYFIVTITRLYDYQALQTHLIFEKFLRCAKVCGLFFSWLSFLVLIGWADKHQSHGLFTFQVSESAGKSPFSMSYTIFEEPM